jgi:phage terminase large subunit-like protein
MSIQSAKFESGQVSFPNEASWLADLETELFAFPNAPHDDQVDGISQALAYKHSSYNLSDEAIAGWNNVVSGLQFQQRFGGF